VGDLLCLCGGEYGDTDGELARHKTQDTRHKTQTAEKRKRGRRRSDVVKNLIF